MKKLSALLLLTTLFIGQSLFAQYSGERGIIINNPETDIVIHPEKSYDLTFSVAGNLTEAEVSELQSFLESKDEVSDVQVNNGVWTLHIVSGTTRKMFLTHFLNNGFKYITIAGTQEEILDYLSHKGQF